MPESPGRERATPKNVPTLRSWHGTLRSGTSASSSAIFTPASNDAFCPMFYVGGRRVRYNRSRLLREAATAGTERTTLDEGGGDLQWPECIPSQVAGADGNRSGLEARSRLVHDPQGRR